MMAINRQSASDYKGLVIFGVFLIACFLFGGASRADAYSQIVVRVIAIICGCAAFLALNPGALHRLRIPLALLLALLSVMLIQFIPLPPSIWTALPGRDLFVRAAALAGVDQPWRPITLIPEATLNATLALLPSAAAVICLAAVSRERHFLILMLLAGMILISGILGIAQVSTLDESLYFYDVTNLGSAVGVFANRNHQAALLAMLLPILAAIAVYPRAQESGKYRGAITLLVGMFVLPLILVTGSRAGLILLAIGVAAAAVMWRQFGSAERKKMRTSRRRRGVSRGTFAVVAAALSMVVVTIFFSRAASVQRLLEKDVEADYRLTLFRPMWEVAGNFFPFGSGFGTFADVFKVYEPDWNLGPAYFNHAHNDILEVVIEGGLMSLVLMLAFAIWWGRGSFRVWKSQGASQRLTIMGRLGSVLSFMLILASFADYPLRTPLGAVIFFISISFLCFGLSNPKAESERNE